MSTWTERRYADFTLRLLLAPDRAWGSDWDGLADCQWGGFLRVARKNIVLIRTSDRLERSGVRVDRVVSEAVSRERQRVRATVELIGKLGVLCSQAGIEFVLTKAFQHYPDMGHDVDLFLLDRSRRMDRLIIEAFGGSRGQGSLVDWIAGKTAYEIDSSCSPIEIHHGRIGLIGEDNIYPRMLFENRKRLTVEGITTFVPSNEDLLIMQVFQRMYDHLCIRLSDIVLTVANVQQHYLDWDHVIRTARYIGIFDGLSCYLSYVDQIYQAVLKERLLSPEVEKLFKFDVWGKPEFRDGCYRFPLLAVIPRIFAKKFVTEVLRRNWEAVVRLLLLPSLAMLLSFRALRPQRIER